MRALFLVFLLASCASSGKPQKNRNEEERTQEAIVRMQDEFNARTQDAN